MSNFSSESKNDHHAKEEMILNSSSHVEAVPLQSIEHDKQRSKTSTISLPNGSEINSPSSKSLESKSLGGHFFPKYSFT